MPFLSGNKCYLTVNSCRAANDLALDLVVRHYKPGVASLFTEAGALFCRRIAA